MGEWAKVGSAPNEISTLLIEGVLKDAGIPALVRRGAGFDTPDFLSTGPRNVLVPEPALGEARQLLEDTTGTGSWSL